MNWNEYPNFSRKEFDSPDVEGSGDAMQPVFMGMLQKARELAGVPFKINSGYRTLSHNKRVGGAKNSAHTRGYAADIACSFSEERYAIVVAAIRAGFKRIGIHQNFVHLDCDPDLPAGVVWVYK